MAEQINKQADIFAIDSMPLEICKKEIKWAKNQYIIHPTKAIVHHKKDIFMAINYTVFVQQPCHTIIGFSKGKCT
jgi:hypothetical protein